MTQARFRSLVAEARALQDLESNALLQVLREPAPLLAQRFVARPDLLSDGAGVRLCLHCDRPAAEHTGDAMQHCFTADLCGEIAGWLLSGEAPDAWLKKAKALSLSTTCGHVFKEDDWAYRCNNCATDPTCCVCAACFENSACHERGHTYVFFRAGPGGCCDCGDIEAWKEEGFCKKHRCAPNQAPSPEEIAIVEQVPMALLSLVTDLACRALLHVGHESAMSVDMGGDRQETQDVFVTCLFNDDEHDMLMVQTTVQAAAGVPQEEALRMTMAAHNSGYCEVLRGDEEACRRCLERLRSAGLAASLTTSRWMPRERQACVLVGLLRNICTVGNGLRRRICQVLLQESGGLGTEMGLVVAGGADVRRWPGGVSAGGGSWARQLLNAEEDLWCASRDPLHELYIQVIADEESKNAFADLFVGLYPRMMHALATTTVEVTMSAIDLSVQIFTVPSIVQRLARHHNLLPLMTWPLVKFLQDSRRSGTLFVDEQRTLSSKLFPRVLHDLSYILRIPHVSAAMVRKPLCDESAQGAGGNEDGMQGVMQVEGSVSGGAGGGVLSADSDLAKAVMTAVLRGHGLSDAGYVEGIDAWLQLCRAMQCMNAHARITSGEHVRYEDQSWHFAFHLARDFLDVQALVLQGDGTIA